MTSEVSLPPGFNFSQGSLQDFVDCNRRFQLRYLERRIWPALESEPVLENERYLQLGAKFHRLIHQHLSGVPAELLTPMAQEEHLGRWWQNYLGYVQEPAGLPDLRDTGEPLHPEISLSADLGRHRLLAKYDLILVTPERKAVILDWKTSRSRPKRSWLLKRLQTRVYPYLFVRAGAHLNQGEPFQADQLEMIYWFANFPERPERIPYSLEQYQADEEYLLDLIEHIDQLDQDAFKKTDQHNRCEFCVYRSLCDRGVRAGRFDENDVEDIDILDGIEPEIDLDFEQIAEIEF
jgi:CRISPR/Cas system-associated exonuclease Cas4 (RecB family)